MAGVTTPLPRPRHIAVSGAGIAGLTVALSLARSGHDVHIYEAAPRLEEVGAGIQLSPNAMHVLGKIGLDAALRARASQPEAIDILDGLTGSRLNAIPLGPTIERRHGAPYLVIHRAALQSILLDAVADHPAIALTLDTPLEEARSRDDAATFRVGGADKTADLLVAADGLNSRIRKTVFGAPGPDDTGAVAWRATIGTDDAPAFVARNATRLWMAPQTHLVSYPIDSGRAINLVLIARGSEVGGAAPFDRLHPSLHSLRDAAEWLRWPLRMNRSPRSWVRGHIVLIGDAAHAMLPTAAQGGAQAIEDGWTLAAAIGRNFCDGTALNRWSASRIARVGRIHAEASRNLRIYGLSGAAALARNAAVAALPARLHLARLDWLYGEDPTRHMSAAA